MLFQYLIFLGQSGRFAEALGHAGHLIETYGAEGETFQQALTITAVGRCWAARAGHLDESLAYARQFRAIADEQGDVRLKAWRAMEGEPYFYLGRWDDVLSATGESLPLAWEIGEATPITFGSSWRGLAALKVGRLDEARRVLDRALTFATSRQDTSAFSLAYLTQVRALLHLAEGQLDDALTLARKAIEFGVQSRFRLELGAAQRVLGQVLEASGDREQAGAALAQSLETFEEIQSLPELGQTLLAYGRFKLRDDAAEGRRLIARAHDIFARIGAVGWVAEAAAAPSSSTLVADDQLGDRDSCPELLHQLVGIVLDPDRVPVERRRMHPRLSFLGGREVVDLQLDAVAVGVPVVHRGRGPVVHAEERTDAAIPEPDVGVQQLAHRSVGERDVMQTGLLDGLGAELDFRTGAR